MKLIKKMGLDIAAQRPAPTEGVKLEIVKGVSPCTSAGFSLEGQFSQGVDLERLASVLSIFGPTTMSEELGALRIKVGDNSVILFSSGSLVIRGENERRIEQLARRIERAVTRALFCQGCGTCVPQCEHDALSLVNGKITVDVKNCTHCLKCDNWPCPTYLA